MKIDLRDEALSKYDGYLKDKLSEQCRDQSNPSFGQYNLLAHLSTYFDNDIVVDIGTGATAASARALSYNETNTVYSYDTEFSEIAKGHIDRLDNVIYEVFNPLKSSKDRDIMMSASLISLDVDPHDGKKEAEFYGFFLNNDWKGIMICDDIRMGWDSRHDHITMASFWNNVHKPKYDLTTTKYSHHTGTGLICFDNQEVFFNLDSSKTTDDPHLWVTSLDNETTIERFDDGTFITNYGTTGTWNVVVDDAGEEKILIKTQSGSIEVPNF